MLDNSCVFSVQDWQNQKTFTAVTTFKHCFSERTTNKYIWGTNEMQAITRRYRKHMQIQNHCKCTRLNWVDFTVTAIFEVLFLYWRAWPVPVNAIQWMYLQLIVCLHLSSFLPSIPHPTFLYHCFWQMPCCWWHRGWRDLSTLNLSWSLLMSRFQRPSWICKRTVPRSPSGYVN